MGEVALPVWRQALLQAPPRACLSLFSPSASAFLLVLHWAALPASLWVPLLGAAQVLLAALLWAICAGKVSNRACHQSQQVCHICADVRNSMCHQNQHVKCAAVGSGLVAKPSY